jgi:multiple antibiotic resistance protein
VLLLLTSLDMLRAQRSRTRSSPDETEEGVAKEDVAIVPLAVPLLAGPGSIATAMVLVSRGHGASAVLVVVAAIGATCFATWIMLRAASRITRALGCTGMAVIGRVMGLLLAAIAVQILAEGAIEVLPGLAG